MAAISQTLSKYYSYRQHESYCRGWNRRPLQPPLLYFFKYFLKYRKYLYHKYRCLLANVEVILGHGAGVQSYFRFYCNSCTAVSYICAVLYSTVLCCTPKDPRSAKLHSRTSVHQPLVCVLHCIVLYCIGPGHTGQSTHQCTDQATESRTVNRQPINSQSMSYQIALYTCGSMVVVLW